MGTITKARARARALRILPEALLATDAPRARPVHMHLEHTTVCDHVCSTCIRALRIDGELHMPVEEAVAHIDAVAPRFLSLNGIGEPLMHPRWDDIVKHAVQRHGTSVGFATTGTHFADQAERICASGVSLVKVSFHGALPRTFSRLASGRRLEVVEHGVHALLDARTRLGRGPEVRLNYVVSDQSFEEIPDAISVAARLRVPAVYFKGALVAAGRNAGLAGEHDIVALSAAVAEGQKLALKYGVDTNLARWRREIDRVGQVPPDRRPPPTGRCLIPWISVFVRIDGTLLPCCNCTWHPDEGEMGRVGEHGDFDAVWRGEAFRRLRREIKDGDYQLRICQDCPDPVTAPQFAEAAMARLWPGFLSG